MQRYLALDFIRGCAILGILLLNIIGFGLPSAAYLNPAWQGSVTLSDAWTWALSDIFAQLKFLTLFALLFGAGLQLQLSRGSRWLSARLSLLVLLGFLHSIFIWEGDILLDYGIIGLVIWRMLRDAPSTRGLINTGILLYLVGCALLLVFALISSSEPSRSWLPGAADIQYEQFWKVNGGLAAVGIRLDNLSSSLMALVAEYGWQLAGLMLTGAALLRSGWLKGTFPVSHYRRVARILLPIGFGIATAGVAAQWLVNWDARWSAFCLQLPRELASPLISIGYAALCFGFWPTIQHWRISHAIQCVGRMALSNYLLQSLIGTTLFYHFGLFMHFTRWQLVMLVPGIWCINLLFSVLWLRYFPQGPVEWIWRRLTRFLAATHSTPSSER